MIDPVKPRFADIPQFPRAAYRIDVGWRYLEEHLSQREPSLVRRVLQQFPFKFSVRVHGTPGLFSVSFDEQRSWHAGMPLRGEVSVDFAGWPQPFVRSTSTHAGDHVTLAGRYVLDGLRVTSRVSLPAVSQTASKVLVDIALMQRFATVVVELENYLSSELRLECMGPFGVAMLKLYEDEIAKQA